VNELDIIENWIRTELNQKNAARERALAASRELIRLCANAIRAVHRSDTAQADALLLQARERNAEIVNLLGPHPDLYYAGYVQDAQKELVEAECTRRLVFGDPLPDPAAIGVAAAPFANGLAEAVGELRRFLLDQLRQNDLTRAESLLQSMDEIYSLLVTIDYPDALTGGLRRTTDATRAILERTRGDLTVALRQQRLEQALQDLESRLGPKAESQSS
jgi:translin